MASRSLCGVPIGSASKDFGSKDSTSCSDDDELMEAMPCRGDSSFDSVQRDTSWTHTTSHPSTAPMDLSTPSVWCPAFGQQQKEQQRRSRPKAIPPPLTLPNGNDPLTEFAIIATSPRSPLMQKNLPIRKRVYSWGTDSIHSYAKQPPTPPLGVLSPAPSRPSSSPSTSSFEDSVSSTSPSPDSPFTAAVAVDRSDTCRPNGNWPVPVWHCFLEGTSVRFVDEWPVTKAVSWHLVEDLRLPYAEHGLRLVNYVESPGTLHLRFRPVVCECSSCTASGPSAPEPDVEVECAPDHPFHTTVGGWSSVCPQLTAIRYGLECRQLQMNDVCLPHTEAPSPTLFDFTPEDTSAALTLSGMAKHRQEQIQNVVVVSPPASPTKECLEENPKRPSKRPMNAFMLFAKDYRKELKAQHPDKDNRAISVLLGEAWKSMPEERRDAYAQTSRILAEEKKKLDPDCWKRRQSLSKSW